ncbi:MAG: primosomal protein N' [Eubacteriales bacterium]|nr:primosomal protein N' [Eubacteriales bacterium]
MYAQIIIDINARQIDRVFDYIVPPELADRIRIGTPVKIPFGRGKKLRKGYVVNLSKHSDIPPARLKMIADIAADDVSPERRMLEIADFIRSRYGSTMIQALKCVMPARHVIKKGRRVDMADRQLPGQVPVGRPAPEQQAVIDRIAGDMAAGIRDKYLLYGVTGSGKTQVFIELAEMVIARGEQVIILIPEIALTYQMLQRFTDRFGERVGFIHSKLTGGERYGQVERVLQGRVDIMIGPRSALFVPFQNLGLIVIDEEHEDAYKSDMSPKYDARAVAAFMQERFKVSLINASATPSMETYYQMKQGAYQLLTMSARRNGALPPAVRVVDMRKEFEAGHFDILSRELLREMEQALADDEQVMLFLNRRGYANYILCPSCGEVMKCLSCDVSYTYHRNTEELKCHYCGARRYVPEVCPTCGCAFPDAVGTGTQKVEEYVRASFPRAKVLRMDHDSTSTAADYEAILRTFHDRQADILIGTQMIIKGHDFSGVRLVGMINIDDALNMNSYRAAERSMQLMIQGAGRAGRHGKRGLAIIQTSQPLHYAVTAAEAQDYEAFYEQEILYRKLAGYPPVLPMLKVTVASRSPKELARATDRVDRYIRQMEKRGMVLMGPTEEQIFKLRDFYRNVFFIKGEERIIRYFIRVLDYIEANDDALKDIRLYYEKDPVF